MRTLVEYGLANAAAATALALVAVLVGLVVRRPAVRNALWLLVLVRLVLPPVWTVPIPVPAADESDAAPIIASKAADVTPPAAPLADPLPEHAWAPVEVAVANGTTETPIVEPAPSPADAPVPAFELPVSVFTLAGGVWLAGTAYVLLRSAGRIARFRRALRDAVPASDVIQQQTAELAGRMGLAKCPDVRVVPGRVSPALWMPGLFAGRAQLVLPAGLLPLLDPGQRAAVLAHELAHLRRGDPWVRWLELLVTAIYWWHPLVGWFRRQLRQAEEECCDLWVVAAVGGRRDYATALVETAAYLGESGPVPALASGAGPVRHLQRRVTMIMRATWPAKLTRLGLVAVLGLGGLGLAFGPALAQEPRKERRDPPPVRDDDGPRERGRDRRAEPPPAERGESADREAVEKLRAELERARRTAEEAMERVRAAEEALARAEGRRVPPRDNVRREPGDRVPAGRRPDIPSPPPVTDPRGGPPMVPPPPALPRRPGAAGDDLRDLQQQIEELRRAMEQMRQELRRERGERGDRKDPEPRKERPREDRPREELKRAGREAERPEVAR
jgi:bla regulator protein blaR1